MNQGREDLVIMPFPLRSSRKPRSQGRAVFVASDEVSFQRFLTELSARFIAVPADSVEDEIDSWLKRLVELMECDAGALAEVAENGAIVVMHSCAAASTPAIPLGPIHETALPWLTGQIATAVRGDLSQDRPEKAVAERQFLKSIGVMSGVALPIAVGGAPVCVIVMASAGRSHSWSDEEAARLQRAGEVFANAIVRRQARERLDQKQQELSHLGRVAAMGELASVIAHELDQPLMAVINNAETARILLQSDDFDRDEADDTLKDVVASAMRVAEIVRRERGLLRKSGRSHEDFSLNGAIREIGIFIRAEARQCGTRVRLDLLSNLPPIHGDRVQIQQVVLNLARNGLQAMNTQPATSRELIIQTTVVENEIFIAVKDCGPAVDESHLRRMFEPFYTTKPNGLGMGLSISKSIVDAHRGKLWATQNEDGGVTLHVSLPQTAGGHDGSNG